MENTIVKRIQELMENESSELVKGAYSIICSNLDGYDDEDAKKYLIEVSNYGCNGGSVSGMIYYHETHSFFEKHHEEIFELYNEEKENGLSFELNANNLSWFALEVINMRLIGELGIEY